MAAATAIGRCLQCRAQNFIYASGFSYIGLLLLIAIAGAGLAVVGQVWHTEVKRENELELLFVGEQFRQAIGSYYRTSPGGIRQYPATLQDLLQDKRFPEPRHHLRKIYRDPFTGAYDWGLTREQGRIIGVYSRSAVKPLKRAGFSAPDEAFADAASYREWRFSYSASGDAVAASAVPAVEPGAAGSATAATAPAASALPASSPAQPASARPKDVYANCARQLQEDNATCRSSCGDFSGETCRTCIKTAFDRYRSCLGNRQ